MERFVTVSSTALTMQSFPVTLERNPIFFLTYQGTVF